MFLGRERLPGFFVNGLTLVEDMLVALSVASRMESSVFGRGLTTISLPTLTDVRLPPVGHGIGDPRARTKERLAGRACRLLMDEPIPNVPLVGGRELWK